jgi:2,3-diketo-5-methylthio-1-phosphopentane phosphatase
MNESQSAPTNPSVLVSDFDGTLARRDFYQLVRDHLLPPKTPDYWIDYRAGRLTHFDALKAFFAAAEGGEAALIALTRQMELTPNLAARLSELREVGWDVVVVSAGCSWYIDRLLAEAGVRLPVHANPGRVVDGRLIMDPPRESPFFSPETGIDKAGVVRSLQREGRRTAFAGDGYPDVEAALEVPESLRFGRGDLAEVLRERGERFRPFDRWSEVADALIAEARS